MHHCFRYLFLSLELMITDIHLLINSYIRVLLVMPMPLSRLILILPTLGSMYITLECSSKCDAEFNVQRLQCQGCSSESE